MGKNNFPQSFIITDLTSYIDAEFNSLDTPQKGGLYHTRSRSKLQEAVDTQTILNCLLFIFKQSGNAPYTYLHKLFTPKYVRAPYKPPTLHLENTGHG